MPRERDQHDVVLADAFQDRVELPDDILSRGAAFPVPFSGQNGRLELEFLKFGIESLDVAFGEPEGRKPALLVFVHSDQKCIPLCDGLSAGYTRHETDHQEKTGSVGHGLRPPPPNAERGNPGAWPPDRPSQEAKPLSKIEIRICSNRLSAVLAPGKRNPRGRRTLAFKNSGNRKIADQTAFASHAFRLNEGSLNDGAVGPAFGLDL